MPRPTRLLPKIVSTATPLRISFVGGGTDLPSYYEHHEGAVISSAIDKYIYVTVKRHSPLFKESYRLSYSKTEHTQSVEEIENDIARECLKLVALEPPLYIATSADLPANSGLGSSSSFAVGLLHALHKMKGDRVGAAQLAEEACEVEISTLKNPIGKQDQYAAAFGGLNHFAFKKNGRVEVDHLYLPNGTTELIFKNSLLLWTGLQRSASDVLRKQNNQLGDKLEQYGYLAGATAELKTILMEPRDNFLNLFGELLDKTWAVKKTLESSISSFEIDTLYDELKMLGGLGGKLSGAGGGGFMYELIPRVFHESVLTRFGASRVVSIGYEPFGSRIMFEA